MEEKEKKIINPENILKEEIELEEKNEDNNNESKEKQKNKEETKKEDNKITTEKDDSNKFIQNKRKINKPDISSKASQKKRKKELSHKNDGFCQFFFKTGHCEREDCHFSHDVKSYLPNATFLEGSCPLYSKYGTCPSGFLCLWGKEHIDFDKVELKQNEELMKKNPIEKELNVIKGEDIHKIRKNNYDFKIPKEYPKPQPKILKFDNKLILPSLCTFGNLPYRRIVKKYGCDITMSEMVMSQSLIEGKASEWALCKKHPCEDIFGIQICAGEKNKAYKSIKLLDEFCPETSFFELNCACPIDLVYNNGMGASLCERPNRIETIFAAMRAATEKPITIKVRTGKEENTIANNLIPLLYDAGVANVSIHGRTKNQRYYRDADWDYINECVKASKIPVIGVGDIYRYTDFEKAKAKGVCSVAIARGALVKPWIFKEIKEKIDYDISSSERIDILREYAEYGLTHWGSDEKGVNTVRDFMCHHLTFMTRYVPVHCCQEKNIEPSLKVRPYEGICYRDEMEKLLASNKNEDLVKITEMFLGKAPDNFVFVPKHKSYTV
jgi:tRNA-dihydrouridine synthase 3